MGVAHRMLAGVDNYYTTRTATQQALAAWGGAREAQSLTWTREARHQPAAGSGRLRGMQHRNWTSELQNGSHPDGGRRRCGVGIRAWSPSLCHEWGNTQ